MKDYKLKLIFCFAGLACLFYSCTNLTDSKGMAEGSRFAEISFYINDEDKNPSSERKLYGPSDVSEEEIIEVKLSYEKIDSEESSASGTGTSDVIEKTYESISAFEQATLMLEPGEYNFYLNLFATDFDQRTRLVQSGKIENQTVESGASSYPFNTFYVAAGDCRITYRWNFDENDDTRIGFIKMGLYKNDDSGELKEVEDFELEEIDFSIVEIDEKKYFEAIYSKNSVPNATYALIIELWDTDENNPSRLNSFMDFVSVYGYKTIGTRTFATKDYNQNYFINYNLNGGQEILLDNGNSAFVKKHNSKTAVILPDGSKIQREGFRFRGWYTSPDFEANSKISIISLSNEFIAKDLTVYARWQTLNPVLYLSASGDDENDGSEDNPLKTIAAACQKIHTFGGSDSDWKIYIDGDFSELSQGSTDVIEDEISADIAKTILLSGKNIYEAWYLDEAGKFKKHTEQQIKITYYDSDIEVSVLYDNGEDETYSEIGTISNSVNLVFKADEGFDSYAWTFDGSEPDDEYIRTSGEKGEILLIDTSLLALRGTYDVVLEATKTVNGKVIHYSYSAQIDNLDRNNRS